MLDEPANGLDPEGIRWIRTLCRRYADEGRTVLLSSHLIGEVEGLADDVVVIHRGRVVAAGPVSEVSGEMSGEPSGEVSGGVSGEFSGGLERAFFRLTSEYDDPDGAAR